MSLDVTRHHIEKPEDAPAHLRRTPGVRVSQIVMDYLAHGWSVDEMCRQHPYLSLAEAHAAMTYYFDHQAEVDAEIEAELRSVDQCRAEASPSPLSARMKLKEGLA